MTTPHDPIDPRLAHALRDAAPTSFAPGFSGRVAARLAAERSGFERALERQFVRIVPLAAAASLLLGAYGLWSARASSGSVLDRMLHLPQVTIASAYSSDALFGSAGQPMEQP